MPGDTYIPLASLSGTFEREVSEHHHRFWHRLAEYGAHADDEIVRLWALVKFEETAIEEEAALLWRRLEDIGATADSEIVELWQHIKR